MSYISEQNKAQLHSAFLNKYKIIGFIYTSQNNLLFCVKVLDLRCQMADLTSGLRPQTKPLDIIFIFIIIYVYC